MESFRLALTLSVNSMRYIRQFRLNRDIAVILVIISHWISKDHFINVTPNGLIGVDPSFSSQWVVDKPDFTTKTTKSCISQIRDHSNDVEVLRRRMIRMVPIYYIVFSHY